MSWGSTAFGFGTLAAMQVLGAQGGGMGCAGTIGIGAQLASQGNLRTAAASGLGIFAPSPLTFQQEMQRDVNALLKDWDKK